MEIFFSNEKLCFILDLCLNCVPFQVSPEKGLNVKLSGSGATGSPPTTLSPTVLIVDWRCMIHCLQGYWYFFVFYLLNLNFHFLSFSGEKSHSMPFEVNITIPIEGYEPVQFFLTKMCGKFISFHLAKLLYLILWWALSTAVSFVFGWVCCSTLLL